jgi:hypothetical protein
MADLVSRWRSVATAWIERATKDRIGEEDFAATKTGHHQQPVEPPSRDVPGERDSRDRRTEPTRRFSKDHDFGRNRAIG